MTTTLAFTTPTTPLTIKVCVVQRVTDFPAVPDALSKVLAGTPNWAVFADGQFDQLSNKRLIVNMALPANTPDQNAARKLVAYTQGVDGGWVRMALASTQKPGSLPVPADLVSIEFTAPVTAPGFFTLE